MSSGAGSGLQVAFGGTLLRAVSAPFPAAPVGASGVGRVRSRAGPPSSPVASAPASRRPGVSEATPASGRGPRVVEPLRRGPVCTAAPGAEATSARDGSGGRAEGVEPPGRGMGAVWVKDWGLAETVADPFGPVRVEGAPWGADVPGLRPTTGERADPGALCSGSFGARLVRVKAAPGDLRRDTPRPKNPPPLVETQSLRT